MNPNEYPQFFQFAIEYLEHTPQVSEDNIDINPYRQPNGFENAANLTEVFKKAIISSLNGNRKSNWARTHFGGDDINQAINNLNGVIPLNPIQIRDNYLGNGVANGEVGIREFLLNQFPTLNETLSYLNTLCSGIIRGAKFFSNFQDEHDFIAWCRNFLAGTPYLRKALPLTISINIPGLGFATACDFIKELGPFNQFIKPDVHIKDVFNGLEIEQLPYHRKSYEDIAVFDAVVNFAIIINQPEYWVDKVIWLICSRDFHRNPNVPRPIKRNATHRKKSFIQSVRQASNYNYNFDEWRLHHRDEIIPS